MKKLVSIPLLLLFIGIAHLGYAQDTKEKVKKDTREVKQTVKKDATKVGNEAAEVGSKAKAKVTDKTYADKVGPDGQTIYIDKHSKYYWVDEKGHKQYIAKAKLKNK